MGISKGEAQGVAREFLRDYPGGLELAYIFRNNTAELYGPRASEVPADMKGGYVAQEITAPSGRTYRGRVDVPLENVTDRQDLLVTLRHEVLGHFGVNTLQPHEKRALLDGVIAAREEPTLKTTWNDIDKLYADSSLDTRAEEVIAKKAESISADVIRGDDLKQKGQLSLKETCINQQRLMGVEDLENIMGMIAQGLHDRTRTQQTFPDLEPPKLSRNKDSMKKPFHETVAENLIEQLKAGTAPWQKPWEPGTQGFMPLNPTTGKRYKGINAVHLMAQGRSDSRWLTYNQAKAAGAQVNKGEKGTQVQYWKFSEEQNKLDDNGKPILDAKGKPEKETVMLERPRVFFATVFNAEQISGLPPLEQKAQAWDSIERADHILTASGANISHGEHDRAFYRPATDSIHLPDKSQFPNASNYYATALHELGHWTGHGSRLDRDLSHPFGSQGYAKEELKAEIASMVLGDELGIGHDPNQHAAYVGSWIKALQEDSLEIFRAASDAEKMANYVMSFEQQQIQEHTLGAVVEQQQQQIVALQKEEFSKAIEDEFGKPIVGIMGLELPDVWGGEVQVRPVIVEGDYQAGDQYDRAPQPGETPQAWRIEAKDAQTGDWEWFATAWDEQAAVSLEGRLSAVGSDTINQKQSNQATVQPDPLAILQDSDMQRRIADFGQQQEQSHQESKKPERTYIDVPYSEKNEAKGLGARWDRQQQSWYVPPGVEKTPFAKWAQAGNQAPQAVSNGQVATENNEAQRQYLAVPYEERGPAKAAGAKWDKAAKSWYVGPNADMQRLSRWLPDNVNSQQSPAMSPREEFAEALKSVGCVVGGDHPIMDGKRQRIAVEGDKSGERAGFYIGHLDGHPAGYISNNRTGVDMKWKAKGYSLDPKEKAKLQAEAADKLAARTAEQERLQEATAERVSSQMTSLLPATQQTPYMQNKGIQPHSGVLTDTEGQKTYIPAHDKNGKMWSMQYIQEDGTKRFAKDSRKEGCFHIVGGDMKALEAAPALVIQEGYATAATNAEALGYATVAAFDSGNLPSVTKALNEKFPDKPVVVFGDNDKHQELTQGTNPGKTKAQEAARAVGGKASFPVFAKGEADYPSELKPITPQSYREHLQAVKSLENAPEVRKLELQSKMLTKEQLAALNTMKKHTDFNDLANSSLGREGVIRQVRAAVSKAVNEAEQKRDQKQVKQQLHHQNQKRSTRMGQ